MGNALHKVHNQLSNYQGHSSKAIGMQRLRAGRRIAGDPPPPDGLWLQGRDLQSPPTRQHAADYERLLS